MSIRTTCIRAAILVCAAAWITGPMHADIVNSSGVVFISPPPSVEPGASVNRMDGQVFLEQQGVQLLSSLSVDATAAGTYDNGVGPGGVIAAGATVDSYFVLFDSGGAFDTFAASLTFSTPVLGLIFSDARLDSSDAVLGHSGTKYPTGVFERGQEGDDSLALSADLRKVTFSDQTSSPGDQIRILTAPAAASAVPEPASLILVGLGLLTLSVVSKFLSAGRRERNRGHI